MSYSQSNEETHVLAACAHIERGRFLDLGAYHPTVFSNTRALFERGWGGVLVDPSPGPVAALVREYGNDSRMVVVAAAVGREAGMVKLRCSDDAVSSTDPAHIETWSKVGGYYGWLQVPAVTVMQLIEWHGPFDMVSIDTEGTSVGLLADLLLSAEPAPACIVVEYNSWLEETKMVASDAGYDSVYTSDQNLVLVKR
jgi:FkbM family methyltransferase